MNSQDSWLTIILQLPTPTVSACMNSTHCMLAILFLTEAHRASLGFSCCTLFTAISTTLKCHKCLGSQHSQCKMPLTTRQLCPQAALCYHFPPVTCAAFISSPVSTFQMAGFFDSFSPWLVGFFLTLFSGFSCAITSCPRLGCAQPVFYAQICYTVKACLTFNYHQ